VVPTGEAQNSVPLGGDEPELKEGILKLKKEPNVDEQKIPTTNFDDYQNYEYPATLMYFNPNIEEAMLMLWFDDANDLIIQPMKVITFEDQDRDILVENYVAPSLRTVRFY
ncbi:hypothetical protein M8C21_025263, partial [Ambrosia artemisiifolia]